MKIEQSLKNQALKSLKTSDIVDDIDDVSVEENYRMYLNCFDTVFTSYNFDLGKLEIENLMDLISLMPKISKISDEIDEKCPINVS